jgi:hypothetical protein
VQPWTSRLLNRDGQCSAIPVDSDYDVFSGPDVKAGFVAHLDEAQSQGRRVESVSRRLRHLCGKGMLLFSPSMTPGSGEGACGSCLGRVRGVEALPE